MRTCWAIARVIGVIGLLGAAGALLVDPRRLPLALRGIRRTLARDRGERGAEETTQGVSLGRRLWAFALVLLAFIVAFL